MLAGVVKSFNHWINDDDACQFWVITINWCYWSVFDIYSNIWSYWLFEIHSIMMILMIQGKILCLLKTGDFKGFEAVFDEKSIQAGTLVFASKSFEAAKSFGSKSFLEISKYQTWLFFIWVFSSKCFPLPLENVFLFLERVKSQCGEDIRLKIKMWFTFSRKCQKSEYRKKIFFFPWMCEKSVVKISSWKLFFLFLIERVRSHCGKDIQLKTGLNKHFSDSFM